MGGVNTILKDSDGNFLELQFHTKESIEVKEKSHPIYEELRISQNYEEIDQLREKLRVLTHDIKVPENIEDIRSFDLIRYNKDEERLLVSYYKEGIVTKEDFARLDDAHVIEKADVLLNDEFKKQCNIVRFDDYISMRIGEENASTHNTYITSFKVHER